MDSILYIYLNFSDLGLFDKELHVKLYPYPVLCSVCNPSQAGINRKCQQGRFDSIIKTSENMHTKAQVWCLGTFQWNALLPLHKTMNRLHYNFSGISTPILRPLNLYIFWEKMFGMVWKALLKFKICHTYHFLSTWQILFFYRDDTIYTWQPHRIYFYLLIMLHRVIN